VTSLKPREIHFDDGRCGVYKYRHRLGKNVVWFITTSWVGKEFDSNPVFYRKERFATWDQIRECVDLGWEIGNHSHIHADFTKLTEHKIRRNIIKSQEIFQRELGFKPKKFAYPRGKYNEFTEKIVSEYFDYRRTTDGKFYGVNSFRKVPEDKIPIFHDIVHSRPRLYEYCIEDIEKICDK